LYERPHQALIPGHSAFGNEPVVIIPAIIYSPN